MVYVRWTIWGIFWALVLAVLHYTLPQTDVVRVTDTYEKRVDFGENSLFWSRPDVGNAEGAVNRDVFFIQTVLPNGNTYVYRNEDTGWGWPPYFKFDTANLQGEAADLKSTAEAPRWAAVRHYGVRVIYWSIFPNAISAWPVEGPDVRIIPWFRIIFGIFFGAFVWFITVRWRRFRRARIDPVLEDAQDAWDRVDAQTGEARGRIRRWWNSFKGPQSRR